MWFLLIGVLTGFVGYTIYFVIKTLKEKKKIKNETSESITSE